MQDVNFNNLCYTVNNFSSSFAGVLVSVVVPVWSRGKVVGVAGTDVPFSDLISDVLYFSKGDYSYAFLIDRETGNTVIHPQMPTLQAYKDDPVVLYITELEQAQEFQTVLESMLRYIHECCNSLMCLCNETLLNVLLKYNMKQN